jgi:DNA-binding response OmpR family regulator
MNTLLETPSEKTAVEPAQNHASPLHRILLVDDDFYARELHAGVLIRFGYKVDTAKDGADAWKALNGVSYDLLITDNRMPRVTGLDLIKKLRSENMTLAVILASGTVPSEELERHPWLQLDATLPKPFTIEELLDTVKKVLSMTDGARKQIALLPNRQSQFSADGLRLMMIPLRS